MRLTKTTTLAAAAVALNAGAASAVAASKCVTSGVCYQWGVPEASAKAGSGDVYFQLKAPTSWQWIGLGIGSQMLGANMFIMYQDGKGNVTLSTRPGKEHVMPIYSARSDVELLAGSGVVDGNMIANVKCSKCTNLDLSGKSNWIAAWKSGDALDSTSPSATITQHDDMIQFQVDMAQASISSDSNPFVGSGASNSSNSTSTSTGAGSSPGAVTTIGGSGSSTDKLIHAHGIVMSVIFVLMYPIGSILMPLLGKWYIHAAWQFLAFLGMWAGFAIGYISAHREKIFFDQAHTRMGTILVAAVCLQPIFGWIHHLNFLKTRSRGVFSYIHVWYGRALMIVGIVNGGLGLKLADEASRYIIAYSVIAALMALLYVASSLFGWTRSRRNHVKHVDSPVMTH